MPLLALSSYKHEAAPLRSGSWEWHYKHRAGSSRLGALQLKRQPGGVSCKALQSGAKKKKRQIKNTFFLKMKNEMGPFFWVGGFGGGNAIQI